MALAHHPVILCGGAGTRLWPASRPDRPKAFLALTSARTLLQETALRVCAAVGAGQPLVIAAAAHASLVRGQLAEVGIEARIITEPSGRGSAPAIAIAALEAAADPRALMVVVACDHHVPDGAAFNAGVEAALPAAAHGAIVTFGVKPSRPSDAYGYIQPGALLAGAVRRVARFREKPSLADAGALVAEGWLWNSGNFVFAAGDMLDELAARAPAVLEAARAALTAADRSGGVVALGEPFLAAPNIAIDVAVMEKTDRAAVLPVDYAWSDLGAWDAVLEAASLDADGNAVTGRAVVAESHGCLIRAGEARVVAVGLKDIAVVVEDGRVLVTDLARAQQVRGAAARIEES
ncbi:MAG TPA: sugar phosphate nucleotidyltransferase [Caulobacteraceae bacterium]|nr:sugar phosphate nucleotidyltransferase [Caulobacteraceae bacterium]